MIPCYDQGEGPPIVVVLGLGATAAFFDDAAQRLARRHRVVVVELPGHGAAPGGEATVQEAARRVLRVCDERSLREVTLLGWSLGATVAYACLAQDSAARINALVSVEQTPRLTLGENWPHAAFGGLAPEGIGDLAGSITADPAAFAGTLVGSSFAAGTEPDPHMVDRLVAESLTCDPTAMAALLTDAAGQDWRQRLTDAVTVPSLIIHGARSQVYPTDVGSWLARALPGSRFELFAESGHLPFIEEPQRFVSTVIDFASTVVHPLNVAL
ncbi:alpha/beta fold hydrolase [Streptomyces apocyni]|uniref:alpha/beta fold hydrolase n=1 Tax=Streptomyces apocyni TaxID=2654677 RepID=UPI0012EABC81|nr:alpha/beta hydrolase [Streptomyces apocyni]